MSYHIFKSWKNIPDIVLPIDTSLRQQLINTKTHRKQKLKESVEETNCRVCSNDKKKNLTYCVVAPKWHRHYYFKDRHDKMLLPLCSMSLNAFLNNTREL